MKSIPSFSNLADRDLLDEVKRLASAERDATAELIASLAEVDARRIYCGEGCSSLFTYCTQVLHLSEHAAYGRIEAARAARRFPIVLELLVSGALTLTAVTLLAPHATEENHRQLFESARHKSKRDVEHLVAALAPRPDMPPAIRRLPEPRPNATTAPPVSRPASVSPPLPREDPASDNSFSLAARPSSRPAPAPPVRPAVVGPLSPERYKVQFTVSKATHDKLRRAQDLLRHVLPNGDPAEVFDRALTLLVAHLEKQKFGLTDKPRPPRRGKPAGRRISSSVRRAVQIRDGNRCRFVGPEGRCTETGQLEIHHLVPFARGGPPTEENLQLRCRAHNQYEADLAFGRHVVLF